jgi:hypothetical protein
MSKQTAVEWLQKQLSNKVYTSIEDYNTQSKLAFEQAKEIEKEQLSDAWYAGDEDGPIHDFEDYYQETYKKD